MHQPSRAAAEGLFFQHEEPQPERGHHVGGGGVTGGGAGPPLGSGGGEGGRIGGPDEKVEGCFNQFDAWEILPPSPPRSASAAAGGGAAAAPPLNNNLVCQERCSLAGYALAATRGSECSCGNDYPSIFHMVETSWCDLPCARDKATCFLFTCCGSLTNSLYTVSFSRPVDVILQLLRKLAFDYRNDNPTFRQKIEGGDGGHFFASTGLQVQQQSSSVRSSSTSPVVYLGVSDGCPSSSWTRHLDGCYRLHWAEPVSFVEAKRQCMGEGGDLVSIESPQENQYVVGLQHGCTSWLNACANKPPLHAPQVMREDEAMSTMMRAPYHQQQGGPDGHDASSTRFTGFHNFTSTNSSGGRWGIMRGEATSLERLSPGDGGDSAWCTVLLPDGAWATTDCEGYASTFVPVPASPSSVLATCYICEKPALAPVASLQPQDSEVWDIQAAASGNGQAHQPPDCQGACVPVTVRHIRDNHYLRCDPSSHQLVLGLPPTADDGSSTVFYARFVDDEAASFILLQDLPGYGISTVIFPAAGRRGPLTDEGAMNWRALVCGSPDGSGHHRDKGGHNQAAIFTTTKPVLAFRDRGLAVAVVTRSEDLGLQGLQECSLGLYDLSPQSLSYTCRPVAEEEAPTAGQASSMVDKVWFEQQSLLFFDRASYARPRVPVPNGRIRCENGHATSIAACSIAYGQGLTWTRIITLDWNYIIQDTITNTGTFDLTFTPQATTPAAASANATTGVATGVAEAGGGGVQGGSSIGDAGIVGEEVQGGGAAFGGNNVVTPGPTNLEASITNDFTLFFQEFFEVVLIAAIVETRNWQLTIPVPPLSTANIQLWFQTIQLSYRWRALFAARGGMRIKYFNTYIGSHHSIGDLTSYQDRYFYMFGRYETPREASITVTVDNRDGYNWPLEMPPPSMGDQVTRGAARTGQLGFGYRR